MKRVLSLALAVSLLGSTAAMAGGWGGHRHGGHYYGSHHSYYRGNNNAAAAVGLGIFALGALAIISSQNANREPAPAYYDRYGPPPGAYDDRYGPPPGAYDNRYDDENYGPPDDYNTYEDDD